MKAVNREKRAWGSGTALWSLSVFSILLMVSLSCSGGENPITAAPDSQPAAIPAVNTSMPPLAGKLVIGYGQEAFTSLFIRNLLIEVYAEANRRIEFRLIPGAASLELASLGEIDGDIARAPAVISQYGNLRFPPYPLHTLDQVIITRADHPAVSNIRELKGKIIGMVSNAHALKPILKDYNPAVFESNAEAIIALQGGSIDAAVLERFNSMYEIRRLGYSSLNIHESPVISSELYHVLNRRHEKLLPLLERAIARLRREGGIDRIFEITSAQLLGD